MSNPAVKRRRSNEPAGDASLNSLSTPISPPRKMRGRKKKPVVEPSPFRLTKVQDIPDTMNGDAVTLHDILGDPLIAECWVFNYQHDVDFIMDHFDVDTRSQGLVNVHIVHGFWKREDMNKILLHEQASQHQNVTLHTAYMPEPFGTHHTKMLVLIRYDDSAQVVIHTANMIPKDWTHMTQGVWQSPLLPLRKPNSPETPLSNTKIGSGQRFKHDLLNYLREYNTKRDVCSSLVEKLQKYDFSSVRGVLVGSVPGKHELDDDPEEDSNSPRTRWGWPAIKNALQHVPVREDTELVVQVSSIATLGPTDKWLKKTLFGSLSPRSNAQPPNVKVIFPTATEIRTSLGGYASGGSIHTKIQSSQQQKQLEYLRPHLCHWANDTVEGIVEPGEVRHSGRKRSAPHIKTYMRQHHYHHPPPQDGSSNDIRTTTTMDWALLTSANVSKQAWGEAPNAYGEVRVASWELGVLVWPELLVGGGDGDGKSNVSKPQMLAAFKSDLPSLPPGWPDGVGDGKNKKKKTKKEKKPVVIDLEDDDDKKKDKEVVIVDSDSDSSDSSADETQPPAVVGLRMPYTLPLARYGPGELPWVASAEHPEPDWMGATLVGRLS